MALRLFLIAILFFGLFLITPYLSSEEVYRWTDEKGTIHFTDDVSKIPEKFRREAEGIDVADERDQGDGKIRESGKSGESGKRKDRVKDYLETIDKKIEVKKRIEKKISELEEEMRLSEERLKWIEDYERENYLFYIPFKDTRTGKLVPMGSPYYEEKVRLKRRIESINSELKALQEKLSEINRSL
jgi:predicted  nucleic acid-binding Zn-ribbon protein